MLNCKTLPIAFVSAASMLLSAAAYASEEEASFAARIGWLHQCLAIKNDALGPGTPVTIIVFGWGHDPTVMGDALGVRIAGKILGKTESGEICPALGESRRGVNEQTGMSFYEISLEEGRSFQSTDLGIGIIGLNPDPARSIDLDGNGVADSLTACTSLEGVHFAVWKDEPYAGKPFWTDYYYVGYDVEPDCPDELFL